MARFQLVSAHHVNGKSLKAGTIICDGTSCSAGDVLWPGFVAATVTGAMVALDAGATTLKAASRFPTQTKTYPTGADSIDA